MAESRQTERDRAETPIHEGEEARRRQRGRNLAVLAALVAFVVAVYFIALARMGGL